MIFCHDKREYMTIGEYMEKYPIAYAEAVESMTAEQKALFAARFEDRYIYLPKDETSDTGENFSISANVTFVTPNADNPESIPAGGTAYWKYTVDSDAEDPVIAVTGCEWVAPAEGMIFLFNPNGNITITVTASLKYYTITTNGENCSFTPSTGKIQARGSQQVFIIPATNYKWNGTLTVTGATAIKNISGSYITLVSPTGDVTVSATCDRIVYPLTVSGINCTPNPKPTQIAAGGTLAITYTAAAGYDLPEASGVGVTGCSFGWNQSTGVLTLYNPTGAVAAGVVAVAKSYAITATVTNGTATGANVIHTGETVALTIAADSGYNLPDTVTVTGASQTWNKETGTLTLSNPTGAVTVSAVCVAVTYPVKGDLITLDEKTYRVLKINSSVAEVLAMYDASTLSFDSSGESNIYVNSNIDVYCNQTFYNNLSMIMQNAIVAKTFQQDSWYFSWDLGTTIGSPKYIGYASDNDDYELSLDSVTYGTSISRKCYALSIQDAIDYIGVTPSMTSANTMLTPENVRRMFWDQTTSISKFLWLRSANSGNSTLAFNASGGSGILTVNSVDLNIGIIHPAFQIDLSKIEWTKQTGETWLLNATISAPSNTIDENTNFLCVGTSQNFIRILIESEGKGVHLEYFAEGDSSTSGTSVSAGGTSVSSEYRTLTFSTAPTGDLLTWLQTNGTKQ